MLEKVPSYALIATARLGAKYVKIKAIVVLGLDLPRTRKLSSPTLALPESRNGTLGPDIGVSQLSWPS